MTEERNSNVATLEPEEEAAPPRSVLGWIQVIVGRYAIQLVLLALVLILVATTDTFQRTGNLTNVLRQASFAGTAAAGMTLLIISKAFDLSVGGQIAVCSVAAASILPELGLPLTIAAVLGLGVALGVANGLLVTKLQIPAFIATLGTMYIYLAIAFIVSDGGVIGIADPSFRWLGTGDLFGLPMPFVVMAASYGICFVVLRWTTLGRHIRSVGTSEEAARVAGIPVARVRVMTFALMGFFTAVASIGLAGLLSSANATMALGYELQVIAIVVIGGTSLFGGRGTLLGSFTGALFLAVLNNGLNLLGIDAFWQYVALGLVLITGLSVEGVRTRLLGAAGVAK